MVLISLHECYLHSTYLIPITLNKYEQNCKHKICQSCSETSQQIKV